MVLQFADEACDGTLNGKNLLPHREQIILLKCTTPYPWKELEIISVIPFHSMF